MTETEHLLVCLMEEAGEIIQAASKALRFGLTNGHPDTNRTNAMDIQGEISHLLVIARMLTKERKIPFWGSVDNSIKMGKVIEYIKYAKQEGTIHD